MSNISSCYNKLGKKQKALEYISKATHIDEKYAKGFFRKGDIEFSLKMYEDAEHSYKNAQSID